MDWCSLIQWHLSQFHEDIDYVEEMAFDVNKVKVWTRLEYATLHHKNKVFIISILLV